MTLFRQLSWKLRWHTWDGKDRYSERPRMRNQGAYLDLPPNRPTLVELTAEDRVDINDLLKVGAIALYSPPQEGGETT